MDIQKCGPTKLMASLGEETLVIHASTLPIGKTSLPDEATTLGIAPTVLVLWLCTLLELASLSSRNVDN